MNAPMSCDAALEAIQRDPLETSPALREHLAHCPACAEARVLWLSLDEAPTVLAPRAYLDELTGRVMAKLPTPPTRRRRLTRQLAWWSAASFLLVAGGIGGFLAGRAGRPPVEEASIQRTEPVNLPEAPFHDPDDAMGALPTMTAEESSTLLRHLERPSAP